jgi:hypothetical protein
LNVEDPNVAYTASRYEMMQRGVPDNYIESLLDDSYMERLIHATDAINARRKKNFNRYLQLNKIILGVLIAQSLLGIFLALAKAIQPDKLFNIEAVIDDVDVVLMLDASDHMTAQMSIQHKAAVNFTGELRRAMDGRKVSIDAQASEYVVKKRAEEKAFYIPILSDIVAKPDDRYAVLGGGLTAWAGLFNALSTQLLTRGNAAPYLTVEEQLKTVTSAQYGTTARFLEAIKHCEIAAKDQSFGSKGSNPVKRYCAIMGDNEAMCQKRQVTIVDSLCEQWGGDLCPPDHQENGVLLEYAEELQSCSDYAQEKLGPLNMTVVLMFTTGSDEESQYRLQSVGFRKFVEDLTGCSIVEGTTRNNLTGFFNLEVPDDCNTFMLAKDFDELALKARKFAQSLNAQFDDGDLNLDAANDWRWWLFLLLPLNLIFYIIWSKLLRFFTRVKTKVHKAMGKKKKMIKVTKTIIEKAPQESIQQFAAGLTEVELAEMESSRPAIQMGEAMTLRARLKGGFVRANQEWACADGCGQPYSADAYWSFEAVTEGDTDASDFLQTGGRVRIRGGLGHVLTANELGSGLAGQPGEEAAEFEVELCEETGDATCHLGDVVRLKCCATGKYLRVNKDGSVDGVGSIGEVETQLAVDRGGEPIVSGSIVQLHSQANGECMACTEDGTKTGIGAVPCKDGWECWLIEKKMEAIPEDAVADGAGAYDATSAYYESLLKDGDVVTLRCVLQKNLGVDTKGNCCCEITDDASVGSPSSGAVYEFVVERMGMNLVRKKDVLIRNCGEITLRPFTTGPLGDQYIKVDGPGTMTANGRSTDVQCCWNIELGSLQRMAAPIRDDLDRGDAEFSLQTLWNKNEATNVNAMAAPWTTPNDMANFSGQVVVASRSGQYVVPKGKGEGENGWVAVVHDGVDVRKAAETAKAQGASGMIVRCQGGLSIDKLSDGAAGGQQPTLPTFFVDSEGGKTLDERGIQMSSGQFTQPHLSEAMRVISKAGNNKNACVTKAGFAAVSRALLEGAKEGVKKSDIGDSFMSEGGKSEDPNQADFKWKVSSNTHYLWSSGGGGAAKMDVNFGKKAPPSAMKKMKLDADGNEVSDASQSHNTVVHKSAKQKKKERRENSVVMTSILECEHFQNQTLSEEMTEILADGDDFNYGMYGQQDQLADDSDFRIQYNFEEVEVGVGEKAEEMEEDELLEDTEGTVVGSLTVPANHFWMVATGLAVTTILLFGILFYILANPPQNRKNNRRAAALLAEQTARAAKATMDAALPTGISLRGTDDMRRLWDFGRIFYNNEAVSVAPH